MSSTDQFLKDSAKMQRASWMASWLQYGPALTSAQQEAALKATRANEELQQLASSASSPGNDDATYAKIRANLGLKPEK